MIQSFGLQGCGEESEGHWVNAQRPGRPIVRVLRVTRHPLKGPASVVNQRPSTAQPQTDKERASAVGLTVSSLGRAHCPQTPTPRRNAAYGEVSLEPPSGPQAISVLRGASGCWEKGFSMAARLTAPGFDVVNSAGGAGWQGGGQGSTGNGISGTALVKLKRASSCLFHTKRRLTPQLMSIDIDRQIGREMKASHGYAVGVGEASSSLSLELSEAAAQSQEPVGWIGWVEEARLNLARQP
ncbi:hypothetical protein EYF80_038167 [Liparis tanakae]|uniref:Uncharacterized protein n=1 Tax=Liparis tanakae TaxID=230148 RepID=A0A4Z2GEL4_9TELE|nr:hypothetical protein EYF80_038167 [Liparis tanakae]